jgi:hypothetical protein
MLVSYGGAVLHHPDLGCHLRRTLGKDWKPNPSGKLASQPFGAQQHR